MKKMRKRYSGSSVVPVLLAVLLVLSLAICGCGDDNDASVLTSEKKLEGMTEACQTIRILDGETERSITVDEITALPHIDVTAELVRSNGMRRTDDWRGVSVSKVLEKAGVTGEFTELEISAWDGYVGPVSYEISMLEDTILADEMAGEPLPMEDGPVRLVVASEDGFYWIRMITQIEVKR